MSKAKPSLRVPGPEQWCVKKRDLKMLRRMVRGEIDAGRILPTEGDRFDPQDNVFGPSVYTVTEQLIKPVTAEAGARSWALMRHPDGLQCDLFITHAWQEGIFEFLDKVIHTWPHGAKHAWCCMLANPQNSDIAGLLRRPSTSPFAAALRCARWVLVVPNRQASIYTRLWCAYEAFLAYRWNKIIMTANSRAITCQTSAPWMGRGALATALGAACSFTWDGRWFLFFTSVFHLLMYLAMVAAMLSAHQTCRRCCNLAGAFQAGFFLAVLLRTYFTPWLRQSVLMQVDVLQLEEEDFSDWLMFQALGACIAVAFFGLAEIDCSADEVVAEQARELRNAYTGTITDARCSNASDEESIRGEIGEHACQVDAAVHVLVKAGMSTKRLRRAHELGVDIEHFGCDGLAFRFLIVAFCVARKHQFRISDAFSAAVDVGGGIISFTFLVMVYFSPHDEKAFCGLVLQKVAVLFTFPWTSLLLFMSTRHDLDTGQVVHARTVIMAVQWMMILPLCVARIDRVAAIPLVGRPLAQFLVARDLAGIRAAFRARGAPRQRPTLCCCGTWGVESNESESDTDNSDEEEDHDCEIAARRPSHAALPRSHRSHRSHRASDSE